MSSVDMSALLRDDESRLIDCAHQPGAPAATSNSDPSEPSDTIDDFIVSISWHKGTLAAAYFKLCSMEMYVTEETFDLKPDYPLLHNLFRTIKMRHLVVSGSNEFIKQIVQLSGHPEDKDYSEFRLHRPNLVSTRFLNILSNDEKMVLSNRRRILNMEWPGMPTDLSEIDRQNYVGTILPLHQTMVLHAMGNLLFYLDSNWKYLFLVAENRTTVSSLDVFRMNSMVLMDEATTLALQIFSPTEHHPSGLKRGESRQVKEGLSLYTILNRCHSKYGSRELKAITLQPTRNVAELHKRLDCIEWCIPRMKTPFILELCRHLRGIGNLSEFYMRLVSRGSKPIDWKLFHRTVLNMYKIGMMCKRQMEADEVAGVPSNAVIGEIATSQGRLVLQKILCAIYKIMDIGMSLQQGTFVVKDEFDPVLQDQKQQMVLIKEHLLELSQSEVAKFPSYVGQCIVIYLEHFGFLLGIHVPDAKKQHFIRTVESMANQFSLMYQDQSCMFFQTPKTKLFNDNYSDLHSNILSRETHIGQGLLDYIHQSLQQAPRISRLFAQLDCVIAMAKVSLEMQLVRPNLVTAKELSIRAGWHILLQNRDTRCTANDTRMGVNEGKLMTILNAPNASGKSVYLKQVAIIAYMAHIGCYVPAAAANIGLLDAIYSRIYSLECTHQSGSAFLHDLQQMAKVMTNSTSHSLILVDEFGKGTNVLEGQAILSACIENLVQRGGLAPITFVSTHYRGVYEGLCSQEWIRLQTFECVADRRAEGGKTSGNARMRSTFRLIDGVGGADYAFQCGELGDELDRMLGSNSQSNNSGGHVVRNRIEFVLRILKLYLARPNGLSADDCLEIKNML